MSVRSAIARKGDPVSHNEANLVAMAGFDAIVLVTVLSMGRGLAALGKGAGLLARLKVILPAINRAGDLSEIMIKFPEWVGSISESETGTIKEGSADVFAGGEPVARVTDQVDCAETWAGSAYKLFSLGFGISGKIAFLHSYYRIVTKWDDVDHNDNPITSHIGVDIISGSRQVVTNGYPTARVGSRVDCGSTVSKGLESVGVGGEWAFQAGEENPTNINAALATTLWAMGWIGSFAGIFTSPLGAAKFLNKKFTPEPWNSLIEPMLDAAELALDPGAGLVDWLVTGAKVPGAAEDMSTLGDEKPYTEDYRAQRRSREAPKKEPLPPEVQKRVNEEREIEFRRQREAPIEAQPAPWRP